MSNIESREIVDIPVIKLTKESIIELLDIITDKVESYNEYSFIFEVEINETDKITFKSKEEFIENFPDEIYSLYLKVNDWVELDSKMLGRDIVGGITINLGMKLSSFQIHSYDKTWFLGKKEQLKTFFNKNKAWYSYLHNNFPHILGSTEGIFYPLVPLFLVFSQFFYFIFSIFVIYISRKSFNSYQKGTLFPKTKFQLSDDKDHTKLKTYLILVFTILGGLSGFITLLYTVITSIE